MQTADFDYELPPELIAQAPAPQRDQSRLLVLHRKDGATEHRRFGELPGFLRAGDVLVLNNSRVIPARLRARNARTDGEFELLLLEEAGTNDWWAMLRPGKRARPGTEMALRNNQGEATEIRATVLEKNAEGHGRVRFSGVSDVRSVLDHLGEVPLPPYIERAAGGPGEADRERYQTVYAQPGGSVAAPTAGLHFTEALLEAIRAKGVEVCFVTLHVGLGTFAPVKAESVAGHIMHEERYEVSGESAEAVNRAKGEGRRVLAVGTTSLRVLESAAGGAGGGSEDQSLLTSAATVRAGAGRTKLFVYPPHDFRIVDGLLTNFHLPRSTLLMLVSAFASPGEARGREMVLSAYREAVRERYRFFSYGDAMLVL